MQKQNTTFNDIKHEDANDNTFFRSKNALSLRPKARHPWLPGTYVPLQFSLRSPLSSSRIRDTFLLLRNADDTNNELTLTIPHELNWSELSELLVIFVLNYGLARQNCGLL
jgi:hypothetical protein